MAIKARRCFVPISPSDWVAKVFLTCDNRLAVQFKHGEHVKKVLPHGPGAYVGQGGVPGVCCLYAGTQGELAATLHELAQVWTYAGEWVHAFLYRKFGYQLIAPPSMCGNCSTVVGLSASNNSPSAGDVVTFTATVTNTDGDAAHGAAPTGFVTFQVDGTTIGTVNLPSVDSGSTNTLSVPQNWTATSGNHAIQAVYTPSNSDFASGSASMNLTVSGGGQTTTCCPSDPIPDTLYLTVANVSGCACLAGTYELTWGGMGQWSGTFSLCSGLVSFTLQCDSFSNHFVIDGPWGSATMGSLVCSPFSGSVSNVEVSDTSGVCTGTVNLSVTQ